MTYSAIGKRSGLDLAAYDFLFHKENIPRPLAKHWEYTFCYRGGERDIWCLDPRVSDARPEFHPVLGDKRNECLLSFVTQYRNTYTVGPLDYCGIAKLVHGRGNDVYVIPSSLSSFSLIFDSPSMLVCNYDPRISQFYNQRRGLEKETIKLKAKGAEHSGIEPTMKRKLLLALGHHTPSGSLSSSSSSPISVDSSSLTTISDQTDQTEQRPRKRLRRSADRDLNISMILSTESTIHTTRSTSRI